MEINNMIKQVSLILCTLQLVACATTQPSYQTSSKIEDKIIAIGKISSNQQNKIVFTGEQYTYIADQGGDTVFKIVANTKPEHRSVVNRLPIEFKMVSKTDFITSLNIRYDIPISQLEPTIYENLKTLGFSSTSYHCKTQVQNDECKYPLASIQLRGKIYEKDTNSIPFKLKQPYPIYITEKESIDGKKASKKAGKVLKTIVIAPLAVAGAILYVPIVLTGAVLSIGNPDAWH